MQAIVHTTMAMAFGIVVAVGNTEIFYAYSSDLVRKVLSLFNSQFMPVASDFLMKYFLRRYFL